MHLFLASPISMSVLTCKHGNLRVLGVSAAAEPVQKFSVK